MLIGFVYDLRSDYLREGFGEEETAEFDRESTIEEIEAAIMRQGHQVERIGHVRALAARLVQGARWDLVFNIAEGLSGFGREAQVPCLLDAYQIPYTFSDPLVSALTLHKGLTKHLLRDMGLPTAPFASLEAPADAGKLGLTFPLFTKPVAEGTSKGIDAKAVVRSQPELDQRIQELVATYRQPVLVEQYLSGREVTVGILGTGAKARAIATLEIALREGAEPFGCTYLNKENCEVLCDYFLAEDELGERAKVLALDCWRALGCRDGGRVDLRADEAGNLFILEVNPLPGLHPSHSDLPMLVQMAGMTYDQLIAGILESAAERVKPL